MYLLVALMFLWIRLPQSLLQKSCDARSCIFSSCTYLPTQCSFKKLFWMKNYNMKACTLKLHLLVISCSFKKLFASKSCLKQKIVTQSSFLKLLWWFLISNDFACFFLPKLSHYYNHSPPSHPSPPEQSENNKTLPPLNSMPLS